MAVSSVDESNMANNGNTTPRSKKRKNLNWSMSPQMRQQASVVDEETVAKKMRTPDSEFVEGYQYDAAEWSPLEEQLLVDRLMLHLPVDEAYTIKERTKRINWNLVAFGNRTTAQCEAHWNRIFDSVKRRPTLAMWVSAANVLIKSKKWRKEVTNMPRKPAGAYIRFSKKKRQQIIDENPSLNPGELNKKVGEAFRNLSDRKKMKYEREAEAAYETYLQEVEQYKEKHPEMYGPRCPPSAKYLYTQKQVEHKLQNDPDADPKELRVFYLNKWSGLKEKRKAKWIATADELKQQYKDDVVSFAKLYPSHVTPAMIRFLDARDKPKPAPTNPGNDAQIQARLGVAGRAPPKPPTSGYSLFCQQNMKKLPDGTQQSLSGIAQKWRSLSGDERSVYNNDVVSLWEEYKILYKKYLESLTDEERTLVTELAVKTPKKKKSSKSSEKALPKSALMWYISEHKDEYMEQHPDHTSDEVFVNLQEEYLDLTDEAKAKYKDMESLHLPPNQTRITNFFKETQNGTDDEALIPPRKPPTNSGYYMFASEIMTLLLDVEPTNRFSAILQCWKRLDDTQRHFYSNQSKAMNAIYEIELQNFLKKKHATERRRRKAIERRGVGVDPRTSSRSTKRKKKESTQAHLSSTQSCGSSDEFV